MQSIMGIVHTGHHFQEEAVRRHSKCHEIVVFWLLWQCGSSSRPLRVKRRRITETLHNSTKDGDKPNGWIATSPGQHHSWKIPGWRTARRVWLCVSVCVSVDFKQTSSVEYKSYSIDMLKQANVATCVQEMVLQNCLSAKINNLFRKMNLDNEKSCVKISLYWH